MKKIILLSLLALAIGNWNCNGLKKTTKKDSLKELVSLMTGSFNSSRQAKKDTAFYDISLQMYPIWEGQKDVYWLYVEQAVTKAPTRPYRQRVYKLEKVEADLYKSIVYTLPEPKRFIGKWKEPAFFDTISPDDLELRDGCAVYLRKVADKYFRGATKEGTCKSTLRGATFATSEVEVFDDKIISWDRGYNDKGEQVWGATKGGYIFQKIN